MNLILEQLFTYLINQHTSDINMNFTHICYKILIDLPVLPFVIGIFLNCSLCENPTQT